MMSQQSQQLQNSNMNEPGQLTVFGMHFCHICKNLMKPFQANTNHVVEFLCERCNQKYPVDFALRTESESLLYSKELQVGSRKYVPDIAYIFDPTMPTVEVECPECEYNKAVYFLTPDPGDTRLLAVMICANATGTVAKCGHSWVLQETSDLLPNKVLTEDVKTFFDEF